MSYTIKDSETIKYVDGDIDGVEIRYLKTYTDNRGWLVELFRHDELAEDRWPVMTYVSSTLPGVARGPHEHVDQTDGFAFIGPSDFKLYLWDTRPDSKTFGHRHVEVLGQSNPAAVWIPPGVVHAYRNVGESPRPGLQRPQPPLRRMGQERPGRRDPPRRRRPAQVHPGLRGPDSETKRAEAVRRPRLALFRMNA